MSVVIQYALDYLNNENSQKTKELENEKYNRYVLQQDLQETKVEHKKTGGQLREKEKDLICLTEKIIDLEQSMNTQLEKNLALDDNNENMSKSKIKILENQLTERIRKLYFYKFIKTSNK